MLPEELSAEVVRKLKLDAEAVARRTLDSAVITVPAGYSEHKRKLVRWAGRTAGFSEVKLLDEQ